MNDTTRHTVTVIIFVVWFFFTLFTIYNYLPVSNLSIANTNNLAPINDLSLQVVRFVRHNFFKAIGPIMVVYMSFIYLQVIKETDSDAAERKRNLAQGIMAVITSLLSLLFVFKNVPDIRDPRDWEQGFFSGIGAEKMKQAKLEDPTRGPLLCALASLLKELEPMKLENSGWFLPSFQLNIGKKLYDTAVQKIEQNGANLKNSIANVNP